MNTKILSLTLLSAIFIANSSALDDLDNGSQAPSSQTSFSPMRPTAPVDDSDDSSEAARKAKKKEKKKLRRLQDKETFISIGIAAINMINHQDFRQPLSQAPVLTVKQLRKVANNPQKFKHEGLKYTIQLSLTFNELEAISKSYKAKNSSQDQIGNLINLLSFKTSRTSNSVVNGVQSGGTQKDCGFMIFNPCTKGLQEVRFILTPVSK